MGQDEYGRVTYGSRTMVYGKGQPHCRLRQLRRARSLVALVLALIACAVASGAVSAQDTPECEAADGSRDCQPASTTPDPDPPTSTTPDPPKPPAPPAPAPRQAPPPAPAAAEPCPDGALPPCEPAAQGETPEARRKRECRKYPRRRRPKRCRRQAQATPEQQERSREERARREVERERRRVARERREAEERRKECKDESLILFGATPGECDSFDRGGILVGRLASRPLPDPLPPSARLDAGFASLLKRTAGDRWPEVLAVLRTKGRTGAAPAGAAELKRLARKVRGMKLEERVDALADYHRAIGLPGLTRGLDAVKGDLMDRVLRTPTISIYGPGRTDVGNGSIDVRVLVTMLYLAERQGGVTVTSLISGHGIFTKSGHVSLHAYGRAMDIVAVGGTPIIGNQQPGGVAEAALRNIMMMPPELRPDELISLFEIGGPSFAMADHADHIHVGY